MSYRKLKLYRPEDVQRVGHGKLAEHLGHNSEAKYHLFCGLVWRTWKLGRKWKGFACLALDATKQQRLYIKRVYTKLVRIILIRLAWTGCQ